MSEMLQEMQRLEPFRREVREWLVHNLPDDWRERMLGADEEAGVAFQKWWFRKLMEPGYAAPHWPKEWGGGGLSFAEQIVLYEEIARVGAPRLILYFVALHHVLGTLLHWGTDEQRKRHFPAVLSGDEIWCQGFSEPGAGSDLASLRCRAERRGDHYVVNGQKTWSSNAHLARYCLLLARTDPDAPKTKGISYFILDLQTPGITLRPIKQMTGASHFNEIFLDDVVIPAKNLVGPENGGWQVAQATLSSERGLSVLELAERMREGFKLLLADAQRSRASGKVPYEDDEIRRQLVNVHIRIDALRLLVNDQLSAVLRGGAVGVEPSIIKLYYSELLREFTQLGVEIGGIDAQYLQAVLMGGANETGYWMQDFLYSWAWTISGGSSEIQRNIIAERGLKLPREPLTA
ncbi:alkylation response protein AidB-like acyl-CoA dehydrogenase [Novosphingobium sp. GV055]|nr:acyl-CoA dehydrogenase family protein [Novosphingobium sp. GV055]PTR12554.1 alkylation response protein AidB-like acyl-CoA dehydrogenase [Novosphingobium sp. GV055]PUB06338.1 alkylation response protein AidB-like acyl-CoA dehydrogenase [Novosphingobium sp. GV061]PUB22389.1 alkylation response protein AidB-like acyl-CoA dehydrogenase [Novosphingobium sp. GV079]PUB44414.1 alkylation response protein AidB-like acyl-CoA dehydrogenase [Novosphingobium sp. GV027]